MRLDELFNNLVSNSNEECSDELQDSYAKL